MNSTTTDRDLATATLPVVATQDEASCACGPACTCGVDCNCQPGNTCSPACHCAG